MNKNTVDTEDQKSSKRVREEAREDVSAQLAKLKKAGTTIGDELTSYVKKQPLASVGIAVGAGFVLGSIFGSKIGRMALVAAVGYAAQDLIEASLGEGGVKKILVDELSKLGEKSDRRAS
jgi:hypothetical protein